MAVSAPIILPYNGTHPRIAESAFIAPGAVVVGDVTIGASSSIWYGCVLRGDVQSITVGENTNIQDGSVIHVTRETGPTHIGSGITIGHKALLHACTLEDDCFIGMGSIILDGARVRSGGMLAAGAMLTSGKIIAGGELWAGSPAKHFRAMTGDESDWIAGSAKHYAKLAQLHAA